MKKIIVLALVALVLISCASCASVSAADTADTAASAAELEALRAENSRLSAELDAVKAEANAPDAAAAQGPVITLYARTAKITEVDYDTDTVTLADGAGLVWLLTGCEDYDVGDLVSLLMSDAGTPDSILDDVIVSASYAGYFD